MTNPQPDGAASQVAALSYRDAMAQLAHSVHLVTTDGAAGRGGFTASAVCSISDSPPTLLVCVNRGASAYSSFSGNDVLCVNTLTMAQAEIATAFGGRTPMHERFACATWDRLATGAPILEGALVSFDCRVVDRTTMSTHDVLFCEVMALRSAGGSGLVYAQRRYHGLSEIVTKSAGSMLAAAASAPAVA